jgi:hypothetical protein
MRSIAIPFSAVLVLFFLSQAQATITYVLDDHSTIQSLNDGTENEDTIPFAPPVAYDAGGDPRGIFCADFDGDSYPDLAVTNFLSVAPNWGNTVSILRNNGDGTFQMPVQYEVGDTPYSLFCVDLDGDSDLDLAVANNEVNSISILKNNGDGTFQPAASYEAGYHPQHIFCADLDGDEDFDVVVSNLGSDYVSILKNYGDGTFAPPEQISAGLSPVCVFCADLDGDEDSDLAIGDASADNVSILKNNGDATFEPSGSYGLVESPLYVFCADLDGDFDLDLAVALHYTPSGSVSILKNYGDGSFEDAVPYEAGWQAIYVVFPADLDGDFDLDLAVTQTTPPYGFAVLRNNGDATFSPAVRHPSAQGPCFYVSCADLDMDHDVDVVTSNANTDNVSIFLNLSNSRPQPYSLLSPSNLSLVDIPRVDLDWEDAVDSDVEDTIRYDLLVSMSPIFHPDSTVIHESLLNSQYTDSLWAGRYYWKVKAYDTWGAIRWSDETWSFWAFLRGDATGDYKIDIADVVYLLNFLFKEGPAPNPPEAGDVNCSGFITLGDTVYLLNYLFKNGPPPCEL